MSYLNCIEPNTGRVYISLQSIFLIEVSLTPGNNWTVAVPARTLMEALSLVRGLVYVKPVEETVVAILICINKIEMIHWCGK